jgi:N-acetylmuramic acid 6-phosphate etherase
MLEKLTTEGRNPASQSIDQLSTREIVALINAEDARVAPAIAAQADAITRAIDAIAERFEAGGRLVYFGAGTSGRLGVLDSVECPPTFNADPSQVVGLVAGGYDALTRAIEGAEDNRELGAQDLQRIGLNATDSVVGIATSGRTPYVLGGLEYARQRGALTIGLSCNADAELNASCDISITPVVGPEVLSGSTRMKAGTATKMVLNMLSTVAMIRQGKTYGNLMVDLRATNSKLNDRAIRIVREATGLAHDAAAKILLDCQGEVKTAIVAAQLESNSDEARLILAQNGGHLRKALESTLRVAIG